MRPAVTAGDTYCTGAALIMGAPGSSHVGWLVLCARQREVPGLGPLVCVTWISNTGNMLDEEYSRLIHHESQFLLPLDPDPVTETDVIRG